MTIKMVKKKKKKKDGILAFRLRDGHSIPILKKKTIEKIRNHPMVS